MSGARASSHSVHAIVGGRVLARQQQRERVADDLLVGEGPIRILGGDHAFEEVLRLLAQLRIRRDAFARLR
jgi:hypothetical protein